MTPAGWGRIGILGEVLLGVVVVGRWSIDFRSSENKLYIMILLIYVLLEGRAALHSALQKITTKFR
jgi:hypothetical protein